MRDGQFLSDPGSIKMSPLSLFEEVARSILLGSDRDHIREVADFKAHMNKLEKMQEQSCAAVCQHQLTN